MKTTSAIDLKLRMAEGRQRRLDEQQQERVAWETPAANNEPLTLAQSMKLYPRQYNTMKVKLWLRSGINDLQRRAYAAPPYNAPVYAVVYGELALTLPPPVSLEEWKRSRPDRKGWDFVHIRTGLRVAWWDAVKNGMVEKDKALEWLKELAERWNWYMVRPYRVHVVRPQLEVITRTFGEQCELYAGWCEERGLTSTCRRTNA